MKKPVTEDRVFCDFCEEPGRAQCMVCDKDLCPKHRVELVICLDRSDWSFRASLCPEHAQPLRPFLESLAGKITSWQKVGHNPEFNEKRLAEILEFLSAAIGVRGV